MAQQVNNTLTVCIRMEGSKNTPRFVIEKLFVESESDSSNPSDAQSPHFKCSHCSAEYALDLRIDKVTKLQISFSNVLEPTQEFEIAPTTSVVMKQEPLFESSNDTVDDNDSPSYEEEDPIEENDTSMDTSSCDPLTRKRRFSCELCEDRFASKFAMIRHMDNIHRGKRWPCSQCTRTFAEEGYVGKHMKHMHQKERRSCEVCHKTTICTKAEYHLHLKHRHPEFKRRFGIPIYDANIHTQTRNVPYFDGKQFPCIYCKSDTKVVFPSLEVLQQHLVAEHGLGFFCKICPKAWARRYCLERHVASVHDKTAARCNICKRAFLQKELYNNHICAGVQGTDQGDSQDDKKINLSLG